jgi:hypothetical protein
LVLGLTELEIGVACIAHRQAEAGSASFVFEIASALVEAQTAVAIDPNELQAQMVLGDTLTALGRPLDAKPAYQQELAIVKTMEPSAEAIWVKTIQEKLAGR